MWDRRRPSIFDMFSDMFGKSPGIEGMEDDWFREPFDDLIRRLEEGEIPEPEGGCGCESSGTEPEGGAKRYGPFVYGFSYSAEPGREPQFQEFGNIKPSRRGIEPTAGREPLVDVMDEGEKYKIYVEMPGADKEKIKLDAEDDRINISTTDKKFFKTVDLDSPVNPDSAKASYRNGVLTVDVDKASMRQGKDVAIE